MNTETSAVSEDRLLRLACILPICVIFLACVSVHYFQQHNRFLAAAQELGIEFDMSSPPTTPDSGSSFGDGPLVINIRADGAIVINDVLLEASDSSDLPQLRRYLAERKPSLNTRSTGVLVEPDPAVPYQRLIDVLSAVSCSGITFYGL